MTKGPKGNRILPKKFTLMGQEYTVSEEPNIMEVEEIYGDADPNLKRIRVQIPKVIKVNADNIKAIKKRLRKLHKRVPKTLDTFEITKDDQVETFYHELVHIILDAMGEDKLYSDERFVSLFGKLLHQIDSTKSY
jgi:hypothetical protein